MSKEILLAWDKPAALADWERERDYPKIRLSSRFIWKASILIHALAIGAIWCWADEQFYALRFLLVLLVPLMPLMHDFSLK